jgi:hypothetical protein
MAQNHKSRLYVLKFKKSRESEEENKGFFKHTSRSLANLDPSQFCCLRVIRDKNELEAKR